jgi:Protein of unknown function (DUF1569)
MSAAWSERLDDFEILAASVRALPERASLPWALLHCAQSIEYSIDGYPKLKPAFIRATVGRLVKRRFLSRGRMNHDITAPVLGAPELPRDSSLDQGLEALRAACARFLAHRGALAPHLMYGACDHDEYHRLHALHITDHLR